ncbi:glutamate--tRNA ligase [Halosquirtibacter xylanolyticus]|uniref:glutamate--tRNA ligase n=1 Tax=Halosquirtibacter xylanolyticus TaxID=3374599 RepID=UPI00374A01BA|nr:glutamate--tRNA ligase [Prolixibacteraceae bacterium]
MSERKVRVRFAPSPTGPLHIGGVRTALFNYLFAKKNGGDFLLRIEDTDQTRYVPGAEAYIIESLKWSGMDIDEGPENPGTCGPYRQSERKEIYHEYALQLVQSGDAYYAFDTPEELDAVRTAHEEKKETFTYNAATRMSMRNSLSMDAAEVEKLLAEGVPAVIRFKMPTDQEVSDTDLIRGKVKFQASLLDDKVLYKADGMPTYHLANVVDDYLMNISHVIRGEEWLPSLPLHILLYEKLGWTSQRPQFAHLPLILKPVGKGKLSKRDGDKLGFPVFPLEWKDPQSGDISRGYREDGYLPEAFVNMLALLGWNPGTEQEIFTMDELCEVFSLERVTKSGARFDPEKTKWFNHQYVSTLDNSKLVELFMPTLLAEGVDVSGLDLERVVGMVKERVNFVNELWEQTSFFFVDPISYDPKVVKKRWKEAVPGYVTEIKEVVAAVDNWNAADIKSAVSDLVNSKEWGFGLIMNALRLAIVGGGFGPDLFDICEIIGKEATLRRLDNAIQNIQR